MCLDCEDNWSQRDMVLWPPVPGQQRVFYMAQAEQEGRCTVLKDGIVTSYFSLLCNFINTFSLYVTFTLTHIHLYYYLSNISVE